MSYLEEIERISMERADKLVEAASKIVDLRAQVAALEKDNDEIHGLAAHYREAVPPKLYGDTPYVEGWNDCVSWLHQHRTELEPKQ